MKKKYLIILLVLIIAVVSFFVFNKRKVTPGESMTEGAKSLKELIAANIPQKCTYSSTVDSYSSEGTTYISGGKVRGDFTSVTEGKTVVSHMISDGKTNYIWTDGEKTGLKMTIDEDETEASSVPETGEDVSVSGGDLNQKFDYKCSAWVPDSSVFNPPTSITFTDLSQMFAPTSAPVSGSGDSSQCSICSSLTGDDKSQCMSALNCN